MAQKHQWWQCLSVPATTASLTGVAPARADSSALGLSRLTLSLPGRMNSGNKPQDPHRLGWFPWICNLLSFFVLCKPYSHLTNTAGHVIPWIPVNLRSNGVSSWQTRQRRGSPPSSPHLSVSSMCATYRAAWGTAEGVTGDSQQPPWNHYPLRQERASVPGHNPDGQLSDWEVAGSFDEKGGFNICSLYPSVIFPTIFKS